MKRLIIFIGLFITLGAYLASILKASEVGADEPAPAKKSTSENIKVNDNNDSIDEVSELLSDSVNLNWPPIHVAVDRGDREGLLEVLEAGADTESTIEGGFTALYQAVDRKRPDLIGPLLSYGANPSTPATSGWTPLHCAAIDAPVEIITAFVEAGAALNLKNDNGHTPLHLATVNENADAIKALLDAGSDRTVQDNGGLTPEALAESKSIQSLFLE
jgi:ankyrin repeat protein